MMNTIGSPLSIDSILKLQIPIYISFTIALHVYLDLSYTTYKRARFKALPSQNQPSLKVSNFDWQKFKMKQAIFLLAFIGAIASVACTGGQDNSAMKNVLFLIEKSMKQRGAAQLKNTEAQEEDEKEVDLQALQSLLATVEDDEDIQAEIEKVFAREQVPAEVQAATYRSLFLGARKYGNTGYRLLKSIYDYIKPQIPLLYNRYRYYNRY